jgi:hypothetical protein
MKSKSEMRRFFATMPIERLRDEMEHLWNSYQEASEQNKVMREALEMVEDNRKMPHHHDDLQTRLYCLAERAREALSKLGQKSPDQSDLEDKKVHIYSQEKVCGDDIYSKEKMRMKDPAMEHGGGND